MSIENVFDLLDGETRTKLRRLIKEGEETICIDDDGIYVYKTKALVIKISVSYYKEHRGDLI